MTPIRNRIKQSFSQYPERYLCLFLAVTTFAVYFQIQHFDFVEFDDPLYVYNNPHIQKEISLESITWAFTTNRAGNWHPLTWLSHMLDYRLFGMEPGLHHLSNLVFHIINALLLFLIFKNMTGGLWQSVFIAALFALHPLHVESVAWVSERKDVLSTFFWMLTLWRYYRYVEIQSKKNYHWVVFMLMLGLLSKPMIVTLPFALLLLDIWPLGRLGFQDLGKDSSHNKWRIAFRLVIEKIPLFILVALSSTVTIYAQKQGGAVTSLQIIPFKIRIFNALLSYVTYIEKTFSPFKLAAMYPYPTTIQLWKVGAACFLLVVISYLAIKSLKRCPYFFVGWFWYLGTLIPVIGLLQVGRQSFADRYTYIPIIGLFIMIAWGVPELLKRYRHKKIWAFLLSVAFFIYLVPVTHRQIGYWKNYRILCEHILEVTSDNFIMHTYFGRFLYEQGLEDEAVNHFVEALRIQPDFIDAHINLGNALMDQGRSEEAVKHYFHVLSLKPDYVDIYLSIANLYERTGRMQKAADCYLHVLKVKPDFSDAHFYLGIVLGKQGNLKDAIPHLFKTLEITPDYKEAHYNIGVALLMQEDIEGAITHFQKELQINPDFIPARKNLNAVLMMKKSDQP